jgi:hypothetical protein
MVTLNHAIECLAIDGQQARCRLFVPAGVLEHARNVTSLNY